MLFFFFFLVAWSAQRSEFYTLPSSMVGSKCRLPCQTTTVIPTSVTTTTTTTTTLLTATRLEKAEAAVEAEIAERSKGLAQLETGRDIMRSIDRNDDAFTSGLWSLKIVVVFSLVSKA
ncbi:hypothetical protein Tsp_10336 [Trichinella spiralis]|uniref:hypothetical protein n=1 Tax=Trichinella spiralis TaxID=6334 RepID=UPI0001EFE381|nr:hypothetical protein Tsp_10336 [Trichinella spiralis]